MGAHRWKSAAWSAGPKFGGALLGVAVLAVSLLVTVVVPESAASATDVTPPSQPGVVTVSGVTASGASLTWGASTDNVGIEGYRVYRGPASAADTALSLIATTDAVASFSATNLGSGYAYKFAIMAIDASNNKSALRTTTLTTLTSSDTTSPAAPSSSNVALTAFSSSRIDVVWSPSSSTDVAYYQVYRDGIVVGTVERPNSQRFSDNGLAASSTHSYTLVAVDSAGNRSAATTAKSATTLSATAVKIARGPYLSDVTATSALVSWWTNIATSGVVAIAGQAVADPAGSTQHHAVPVSGLAAATSYPYTVTSGGVSAGGTLRTAANPGDTFSFAAIGDFGGQSPGETQNAANIAAAGTQFIQTLGDNVYPAAGLPDPNFSTTYSDFDARFFKQFGPAVKSQAYFPANGNKEYYGDGEFWAAFPMPGTNHAWYSYNWGDAHILVLDSEQPYVPGSDQYSFAQADLVAHQSDQWRIVAIQRPAYSSTSTKSSSTGVRQYLVPLFQNEHVNLVLSGNSHNYERTLPLTDGVPASSGGITYVVSGAGGNGFNTFGTYTQSYTAFRESSYYEYAKVSVSPTALTVDAIRSDTNTVFDTITITAPTGGGDATSPTAPTNLAATAVSSSGINLSWTASTDDTGVTGYKVFRDGAVIATVTSGTTFADTGLAASTTHSYTVTATDAAKNESGPSNTATATTLAGGGGPQLVKTASGTTSTALTASIAGGSTAGDLLVVTASLYTGDTNHISSITDSAGNTWTRAGAYDVSGHNSDGEIWYCAAANAVTTVVVHTAATSVAFQVQEYSGVAATGALDAVAGTSNTSTSPTAGPITVPTGDLLIGFVAGHGNTQTITLSPAYPQTQPQTTTSSGSVATMTTGNQLQATGGSMTLTATFPTSMYWAAGLAAFKPGS